MEIILKNNLGYAWFSDKGVHFKGYLILRSGIVLRGEDALKELTSRLSCKKSIKDILSDLDGCFSIVVDTTNYKFASTDISRSMPLFFSEDGRFVSDSADVIREKLGVDKKDVNQDVLPSFLAKGYLIGNETAYIQVKQLDLGQYADFSLGIVKLEKWFYHLASVISYSEDVIKEKLTETATHVFDRVKEAIAGRPVVLSLSGGYDSRFVACMLKKVGVEDVSCYTYGKAGSFEVEQSKRNAEALGFRWTNVVYTDELMKGCVDELGEEYLNTFLTHDYTAYYQNFPAVRKLKDDGWIKPNSVFITGLCGDMVTGNYVEEEQSNSNYSINSAAERLYTLILDRYHLDSDYKERFINRAVKELNTLPIVIKDYQTWTSAVDAIYTGSCHTHAFLNMNRVHEFFGYEWLLPYWDKELLTLWYSIPAEYRLKQKLYEDWLLGDICKPFGLNQRKKKVVYSSNKYKKKIQYFVGGILSSICLNLGIVFRRKYDFNNWASLELELYKRLPCKSLVDYKKAGVASLLSQYFFQNHYGVENVRDAKQHLIIPN